MPKAAPKKKTSLSISVVDISGKSAGKISLPKSIFAVKINDILLAQAVRVYRANKRQGTQSTKTRSEVSGSTKKIYRQKGTGRARHGDKKAPIFRGGGIAHGPKPRDFSLTFPKKMRRLALFMGLSQALKNQNVSVITGLEKIAPKTKKMVEVLKALKVHNDKNPFKILLVTPGKIDSINFGGRNIEGVSIRQASLLNAYQVLNSQKLIFTKDALPKLEETFLKTK